MAEVSIDIALEKTSQEILENVKMIRAMVTDVEKFDWKDFWANLAAGELFSTKFYKYETSTNPAGEKMNASVGLVAIPSTETSKNRDDFATRNAFSCIDCNFIINDSEQRIPTAIAGGNNYSSTGKVDVGVMVPPTYWGKQDFDDYYIIHFSDTPHPEVDCITPTPWTDPDLGYGILTKYYAGNIDDTAYSSSGNPVYNFVSAQSINNIMQKKGTGYHGSGSERTAYLLCMLWIKYATKNSQTVFKGNTSHDVQTVVKEAGEKVNYVVIPTSSANALYVGDTVSIGDPGGTSPNTERGNSLMRNIADKVKVLAIEAMDGTSNSKVYVDKSGMDITDTTYISTMPLHSGTTDKVLGTDGYIANDWKHAFKLGGIEEGIGAYFVSANELWNKTSTTVVDYYVRPKNVAWSSTASGWEKVMTCDMLNSNDEYIGDSTIDLNTGVISMRVKGSGDSVGVGDRIYKGGTRTGWIEALLCGGLWSGGGAGLCYMNLKDGVPGSSWFYACCI